MDGCIKLMSTYVRSVVWLYVQAQYVCEMWLFGWHYISYREIKTFSFTFAFRKEGWNIREALEKEGEVLRTVDTKSVYMFSRI